MKTFVKGLGKVVAYLLIVFSLVALSFCTLLAPPATHLFSGVFADEDATTLSKSEIVEVADDIRTYCVTGEDHGIPWGDADTSTTLGTQAQSHLKDVSIIFRATLLATGIVLLINIIVIALCCILKRRRNIGLTLILAGVTGIVVALGFAFWSLYDFDSLFAMIHKVFFSKGGYVFPSGALLVVAMPSKFWVAMGVTWVIMLLVFGILCILFGKLVRGKSEKQKAKAAAKKAKKAQKAEKKAAKEGKSATRGSAAPSVSDAKAAEPAQVPQDAKVEVPTSATEVMPTSRYGGDDY